jgi:hypothetical protein
VQIFVPTLSIFFLFDLFTLSCGNEQASYQDEVFDMLISRTYLSFPMFAWQQTDPLKSPSNLREPLSVGNEGQRNTYGKYILLYTYNKQKLKKSNYFFYTSRPRKLESDGTNFFHQKFIPDIVSVLVN